MMTRLEANRQLLNILAGYVELYPDWRFGQILFNAGFATHKHEHYLDDDGALKARYVDIFFEESTDTLNRIRPLDTNYEEATRVESLS